MVQLERPTKNIFSGRKMSKRRKSLKEWLGAKLPGGIARKWRQPPEDPNDAICADFRKMHISEYQPVHANTITVNMQPIVMSSPSCGSLQGYVDQPYSPPPDPLVFSSPSSMHGSLRSSSSLCSSVHVLKNSSQSPSSYHHRRIPSSFEDDGDTDMVSQDSPSAIDKMMKNLSTEFYRTKHLSNLVVHHRESSNSSNSTSSNSTSANPKKRNRRQSSKSKSLRPPTKRLKWEVEEPDLQILLEGIAKVVWMMVARYEHSLRNRDGPVEMEGVCDLEWEIFVHERVHMYQASDLPTQGEVDRFVKNLYYKSTPSEECVIISLIFLHRMIKSTSFELHTRNWVPALFTASLLAQKIWDDESWINQHFGMFCPYWDDRTINRMESSFLIGMDWDCSVSSGEYESYFNSVCSLSL